MTSNQDSKQKEHPIPRTGIQVMNDLSLDARTVILLAHEDLLIPYIPTAIPKNNFKLFMSSRYENPESFLSTWTYRKSDVEEFKLNYKDYWKKLKQHNGNAIAESQKQDPPEQEYFVKMGKKGGEKSKINRPILYAVIRYMEENPKTHNMTNGQIAKKFCKKYKQGDSVINTDDGTEWDIYSDGEYIFSKGCGLRSTEEKSIKFSTLRNSYIPKAKSIFPPPYLIDHLYNHIHNPVKIVHM